MGPWDGERASLGGFETGLRPSSTTEGLALSSWKLLVDNGSMQDGDKAYRATARGAVARISQATYDAHGPTVTLTGDRGSVTLPAEVADLDDGVVWLPANSTGKGVLADLASPGSRVSIAKGADQ
jgi:NADH-quinone oxidoreductase subunit G